jgi:hypothetical protein
MKKDCIFSGKIMAKQAEDSLYQLQQFKHYRVSIFCGLSQPRGRLIFPQFASQKNSPDHMFGVPQGCHSTEESKYATVTMNINHDPNVG